MLTGDAVAIAKETCKQLALGTNVYDSARLIAGGMSGSEVRDFVEADDGFAEGFPEGKHQVSFSLSLVRGLEMIERIGGIYVTGAWTFDSHDRGCECSYSIDY